MNSKELLKLAQTEDNEFRALSLQIKALREGRSERFIEDWLPILIKRYPIELRDNGSYSIITQKYGIIDYFPKANNLLIRKDNKWKKPGLKWMIENILN